MKRLFSRANMRLSVGNAAVLLIGTSLVAQVLGFLRTKLINANFSAIGPHSTDAYFAAFKIPDFFFLTLAAGALGVAFMPFLADKFEKGDKEAAWRLCSSLLNMLAIVMAIVGLVIVIFAEPLIHNIVAPNLDPQQLHNAVLIMRLVALNPFLFTMSGILTSIQQTTGRFFFYAIAPTFYNLSIIASIFLFKDSIGLVGLGIGAFVGAILQFLVALIGMIGINFKYTPKISWQSKSFRGVLRQLPPRSIDQGIDSINSIVETNFARRLGEGNITFYENAYTLHTAPILLIGTAISTAAFPRLTARLAGHRSDLFRKDFLQILRAMIWISMPVVVLCYFARGYLARMIFAKNAPEIALIFGFLAGAIFFRIMYTILSRYFYAQKDTVLPLMVSLFAIALNIYLAYTLSRPSSYGVAGLALAQSIVAAAEVAILAVAMLVRDRKLFDWQFINGLTKIFSVTGFAIVTAYVMVAFLPLNIGDRGFVTLSARLFAISAATLGVYVGISSLFGLEESKPVTTRLKRIVLKPLKIDW